MLKALQDPRKRLPSPHGTRRGQPHRAAVRNLSAGPFLHGCGALHFANVPMSTPSQLLAVDCNSASAAADFTQSLRDTGFGVLAHHPLPHDLISELYQQWANFFASERKHEFAFNPATQEGFIASEVSETAKGNHIKDLKEFYHVYPRGKIPPELRAISLRYYHLASAFAQQLLEWVEQSTPAAVSDKFETPLSSMIEGSEQSLLRIIHYPPQVSTPESGAMRAAAHEDINLLTLLPAATDAGLQVLRRDGSWMDAPTDPNLLIVNVGDMLQEASGGYYPSTTHRVLNPDASARSRSRLSMPLFLHPRPEVQLSARYSADSYLKERLAELGF